MTTHCVLLGHSPGTISMACVHCGAVMPPSRRRRVAEGLVRGAILAAVAFGAGAVRVAIHGATRPVQQDTPR